MTTKMVFFLNRLRADATGSDYERWVREVDYPLARSLPSIVSYRVVRIDGPLRDDEVPFDYLEIVEVSDLDDYRRDLAEIPGRTAFIEQLQGYVADVVALRGIEIE